MALNLYSTRSAPHQVADGLAERIRAGDFAPGEPLPTTAVLCRDWGVSKQTVRNAINVLRAAGLVVGHQGRGVYVADWRPRTIDLDEHPAIGESAGKSGPNKPSPEAAEALDVDTHEFVFVDVRTATDDDGRAVARTVSTWLPDTGPAEPRPVDVLYARVPTPSEIGDMGLQAGVPVLVRERTEYDTGGRAIAHHLTVYNGPLARIEHRCVG